MPGVLEVLATAFAGEAARRTAESVMTSLASDTDSLPLREGPILTLPPSSKSPYSDVLNERQSDDIEAFLQSATAASLIQTWFTTRIASDAHFDIREEMLNTVSMNFQEAVSQWCATSAESWESLGCKIWELATESLAPLARHLADRFRSNSQTREHLQHFAVSTPLLQGRTATLGQHEHVRGLISNPTRAAELVTLINRIKRAQQVNLEEVELLHAYDDHRFQQNDLYVTRTLSSLARVGGADDDFVEAEELVSHETVARAVIIGDPGVGKSTFVRHIALSLSSQSEGQMIPLLVQCRDYAAFYWDHQYSQVIAQRLGKETDLEVTARDIDEIVALGCAVVVFDGIDEIIDQGRRRQFIRRVEAFGRQNPYSSIICTSRKVGYSQARFNDDFQLLELSEFTEDQFREYVRRWFTATGRDQSERDAFMRESGSVDDIRKNPLMLSLLCTLYRARGHIPRNRRQVYRDCADLLFSRWDALRHIPQPFDHRQYGQRLMQELARFFLTSEKAQEGIEEQMLVRLIGTFFRDTAAIDPPDDSCRAQQFLDFCAGRAWLLSVKGTNSRGVRLFAFTHRTFMEYLAAEALVRNAVNVDEIVEIILKVFMKDSSSVLPDVMVQATEDKYDRGAEQILRGLLSMSRKKIAAYGDDFLALCIRIVNLSPMSRAMSELVPISLLEFWRKGNIESSFRSSNSLFDLYRDPRNKILQAVRGGWGRDPESADTAALLDGLCKRWARMKLLNITGLFDQEWSDEMGQLMDLKALEVSRLSRDRLMNVDFALKDSLLIDGKLQIPTNYKRDALRPQIFHAIFSSSAPGSVVHAVVSVAHSEAKPHHIAILEDFASRLPRRVKMKPDEADAFVDAMDWLRPSVELSRAQVVRRLREYPVALSTAVWLAFAVYEASHGNFSEYHEAIEVFSTPVLRRIFHAHEQNKAVSIPREDLEIAEEAGGWAIQWIYGHRELCDFLPSKPLYAP